MRGSTSGLQLGGRMASEKKGTRRSLIYRRCVVLPQQDKTLQQLVTSALSTLELAEHRLEPLDSRSTEMRAIGSYTELNGALCGYLCSFARGRSTLAKRFPG